VCGKRVFDLAWKDETTVTTKCRHCNKIVSVSKPDKAEARGDPCQLRLTLD
jgi:hypothetical protein